MLATVLKFAWSPMSESFHMTSDGHMFEDEFADTCGKIISTMSEGPNGCVKLLRHWSEDPHLCQRK